MAVWSFWDSQGNPLPKLEKKIICLLIQWVCMSLKCGRAREGSGMWKEVWGKIVDYMSVPTLNGSEVIWWGRWERGLGLLGTPAGLLKSHIRQVGNAWWMYSCHWQLWHISKTETAEIDYYHFNRMVKNGNGNCLLSCHEWNRKCHCALQGHLKRKNF